MANQTATLRLHINIDDSDLRRWAGRWKHGRLREFIRKETVKNIDRYISLATRTWSAESTPDVYYLHTETTTIGRIESRRYIMTTTAFIEGDVFSWVNEGTKGPYPIVGRPKLAFQTGYRRKTPFHGVGATSGGKFGPYIVVRKVEHPGIAPRGITDNIVNLLQDELSKRVVAAVQRML